MDEPESAVRPPSPARLSKTPSWVMLGFLLGMLFVWSLPLPKEKPVPPPAVEKKPEVPLGQPRLTAIEAVFEVWGGAAVWDNDLTEVALWNPERNDYTDCFEVFRSGGNNFFRSIPHLTRPVLTRGVPENSPLQYTESEAHRQEWLRQVHEENWRAFSSSVHDTFSPGQGKSAPDPAPPPRQTGPGDGTVRP
jgi:hypothetical protein